jgi:hypothetical protein
MSMQNTNYTIRNRTRDLGACSAVRQPGAPPRASPNISRFAKLRKMLGRTCSIHGEIINGNLLIVGNPKEERSLWTQL